MDRTELQQLADLRLDDAAALLAASRWSAAYYLLGYCIECALKACVVKQFREHEVPDKGLVNSFYTHKLEQLLNLSGAKSEKEKRAQNDLAFEINWNTVRDWKEDTRYELGVTEADARGMYEAVTNGASGVLPWLKTQW
ncbi:MAG: DNA-binding protein [Acidobacteria bacterium]|nr:DNA-binding protein [Acidobacteriota bacterium]